MSRHRKLLISLLDLLLDRLLESLDTPETSAPLPKGAPRQRRKGKKRGRRSLESEQLLELLRAKGPLSTEEASEITGLGSSALSKKFTELKRVKAVQQVKAGRHIKYKATRGSKMGGRKTAPKKKATARRSQASTAAS